VDAHFSPRENRKAREGQQRRKQVTEGKKGRRKAKGLIKENMRMMLNANAM
jgi:hypothetical protein